MSANELDEWLSDYAAPVADDGFSDSVLSALPGYDARADAGPALPWRGALIAFCAGTVAGGIWSRLSGRWAELHGEITPVVDLSGLEFPGAALTALSADPVVLAGAVLAAALCGGFALSGLDL